MKKKKTNYFEMVLMSEDDPLGLDGIEMTVCRECPNCYQISLEEDNEGNPTECHSCGWKEEKKS